MTWEMGVLALFVFFLIFVALDSLKEDKSEPARIKRALRGALRSDVATALEAQMIKVVGVLDYVGQPLLAPLSGRPCAAL